MTTKRSTDGGLEGLPIVDTKITPRRQGVIVSVTESDDGPPRVLVSWGPGKVTYLRLEPGRYLVPGTPVTATAKLESM